jgi:glutathione peroxidase
MKKFLFMLLWLVFSMQMAQAEVEMSQGNAHQFEFNTIDGNAIKMAELEGKVVLVVNTASQCGFTPQYAGLQKLHETYGEQGLVVIGVPSDNFGGQEFDTEEEVQNFTTQKFEATFPLTEISDVTGSNAHPFYQWANKEAGFLGSPKWNFHKYLIGKNGDLVQWYASTTSPDSAKVTAAIEAELAK